MKTERLDMRADPDFLAAIDEWRAARRPIPSRAGAVKALVLSALDAERRPVSATSEPEAPSPADIIASVADKPWRDQRNAIRRAIVAHPRWPALRDRDGLSTAKLSSLDHFRPVCRELGIDVPALQA